MRLTRGEMIETQDREIVPIPYERNTIAALDLVTSEINRRAPAGSTVIVNYAETQLVNGAVYAIAISDQTYARVYRDTGGPERFEPDSTDTGHETLYTQPGKPLTVLGRIIMILKEL